MKHFQAQVKCATCGKVLLVAQSVAEVHVFEAAELAASRAFCKEPGHVKNANLTFEWTPAESVNADANGTSPPSASEEIPPDVLGPALARDPDDDDEESEASPLPPTPESHANGASPLHLPSV